MFVSPALQRGENGFHNFATESRRDGARTFFIVEAAAQHYFHKEPNQLLIGEAALLAGLVARPSYFSPTKHPDRSIQRRNEVIDAMVQVHAISDSDAVTAKLCPLPSIN